MINKVIKKKTKIRGKTGKIFTTVKNDFFFLQKHVFQPKSTFFHEKALQSVLHLCYVKNWNFLTLRGKNGIFGKHDIP